MLRCSVLLLRLFVTLFTVARQAPLSTGFSRQRILEWVAISFLGDRLDPGSKPTFPALAGGFLSTAPPWKPPVHPTLYLIAFMFLFICIYFVLICI